MFAELRRLETYGSADSRLVRPTYTTKIINLQYSVCIKLIHSHLINLLDRTTHSSKTFRSKLVRILSLLSFDVYFYFLKDDIAYSLNQTASALSSSFSAAGVFGCDTPTFSTRIVYAVAAAANASIRIPPTASNNVTL